MANVIIKDDDRRERENEILRACGHSPGSSDASQREMADLIASKTYEEIKKMEANGYDGN